MKVLTPLRTAFFIAVAILILGVHTAHAESSTFPVLHNNMNSYWQLSESSSASPTRLHSNSANVTDRAVKNGKKKDLPITTSPISDPAS